MSHHVSSAPSSLRQSVRALLRRPPAALALLGVPGLAFAGPTGEDVIRGEADITRPDATRTIIDQHTQRAVINWQTFNVDADEYVIFNQLSSSSVVLNRVIGGDASYILGQLQANGQVFLLNAQGVFFGEGASIDVQGFLGSTLDMDPDAFMAGNYALTRAEGAAPTGRVINDGQITAGPGGYVVLAGDYTENTGIIAAQAGTIALVSGNVLTLDIDGDGLVNFAVNDAALSEAAGVRNAGSLIADGGRVIMTARVASDLVATAVNNEGLVRARSIEERNGEIFLVGHGGDVVNSGTLDADGESANGGFIGIRSDRNVILADGGVQTAAGDGNHAGGVIRAIAEDHLDFQESNTIRATGGVSGGFVEVSGHGSIALRGNVEIGQGGTLLIDPTTMTIVTGTGAGLDNSMDSVGTGFIRNQLDEGVDVAIVATSTISAEGVSSITATGTGNLLLGIGTIGAGTDVSCALNLGLCAGIDPSSLFTPGSYGNISLSGVSIHIGGNVDIVNNAGYITVDQITTTSGSITIEGGTINTNFLSAGGDVGVVANAYMDGNINIGNMGVVAGGNVTMNAFAVSYGGGNINIAGAVSAGGLVEMNASAGGFSGGATITIGRGIVADSAQLSAVGPGGRIRVENPEGSAIHVTNGVSVIASGDGWYGGRIEIGNSTDGLITGHDILAEGGNVTLIATNESGNGGVVHVGNIDTGGSVTIKAYGQDSNGGQIFLGRYYNGEMWSHADITAGRAIHLEARGDFATRIEAGNITGVGETQILADAVMRSVEEGNATINVGDVNISGGDLYIEALGDSAGAGILNAGNVYGTGMVLLNANSAFNNASASASIDVASAGAGGNLYVEAVARIGTADLSLGGVTGASSLTVNHIGASGSLMLDNITNVSGSADFTLDMGGDVGNIDIEGALNIWALNGIDLVGMFNVGGDAYIEAPDVAALGDMNIGGTLTVAVDGNIELANVTAGNAIDLDGYLVLTQLLDAGGGVSATANFINGIDVAAGGDVTLSARQIQATDIFTSAGNITVTAAGTGWSDGNINVTNNVETQNGAVLVSGSNSAFSYGGGNVTIGGNVLASGGNVSLSANNVGSGSFAGSLSVSDVTATGTVTLNANDGGRGGNINAGNVEGGSVDITASNSASMATGVSVGSVTATSGGIAIAHQNGGGSGLINLAGNVTAAGGVLLDANGAFGFNSITIGGDIVANGGSLVFGSNVGRLDFGSGSHLLATAGDLVISTELAGNVGSVDYSAGGNFSYAGGGTFTARDITAGNNVIITAHDDGFGGGGYIDVANIHGGGQISLTATAGYGGGSITVGGISGDGLDMYATGGSTGGGNIQVIAAINLSGDLDIYASAGMGAASGGHVTLDSVTANNISLTLQGDVSNGALAHLSAGNISAAGNVSIQTHFGGSHTLGDIIAQHIDAHFRSAIDGNVNVTTGNLTATGSVEGNRDVVVSLDWNTDGLGSTGSLSVGNATAIDGNVDLRVFSGALGNPTGTLNAANIQAARVVNVHAPGDVTIGGVTANENVIIRAEGANGNVSAGAIVTPGNVVINANGAIVGSDLIVGSLGQSAGFVTLNAPVRTSNSLQVWSQELNGTAMNDLGSSGSVIDNVSLNTTIITAGDVNIHANGVTGSSFAIGAPGISVSNIYISSGVNVTGNISMWAGGESAGNITVQGDVTGGDVVIKADAAPGLDGGNVIIGTGTPGADFTGGTVSASAGNVFIQAFGPEAGIHVGGISAFDGLTLRAGGGAGAAHIVVGDFSGGVFTAADLAAGGHVAIEASSNGAGSASGGAQVTVGNITAGGFMTLTADANGGVGDGAINGGNINTGHLSAADGAGLTARGAGTGGNIVTGSLSASNDTGMAYVNLSAYNNGGSGGSITVNGGITVSGHADASYGQAATVMMDAQGSGSQAITIGGDISITGFAGSFSGTTYNGGSAFGTAGNARLALHAGTGTIDIGNVTLDAVAEGHVELFAANVSAGSMTVSVADGSVTRNSIDTCDAFCDLTRTEVMNSGGRGEINIFNVSGGPGATANIGNVDITAPDAHVIIFGYGNVAAGNITVSGTGVDSSTYSSGTFEGRTIDFQESGVGALGNLSIFGTSGASVSLGQVNVSAQGMAIVDIGAADIQVAGINAAATAGSFTRAGRPAFEDHDGPFSGAIDSGPRIDEGSIIGGGARIRLGGMTHEHSGSGHVLADSVNVAGDIVASAPGSVQIGIAGNSITVTGDITASGGAVLQDGTRTYEYTDENNHSIREYSTIVSSFGEAEVGLTGSSMGVIDVGAITANGVNAGGHIEGGSISVGAITVTGTGGHLEVYETSTNLDTDVVTEFEFHGPGLLTGFGIEANSNISVNGAINVSAVGAGGMIIRGDTVDLQDVSIHVSNGSYQVLDASAFGDSTHAFTLGDALLDIDALTAANVNGNVTVNASQTANIGGQFTANGTIDVAAGAGLTPTIRDEVHYLDMIGDDGGSGDALVLSRPMNVTASSFSIVTASGDIDLVAVQLDAASGITLSAGGSVLLDDANLVAGGPVEIDAASSVSNNGTGGSISADSVWIEALADIALANTVISVGMGATGLAGDATAITHAGLADGANPNAAFVAGGTLQLGDISLEGDYLFIAANALDGMNLSAPAGALVQLQPFTAGNSVGIGAGGSGTADTYFDTSLLLALNDVTVAIGGDSYSGEILVGDGAAADLTGNTVALITTGSVTGSDTLTADAVIVDAPVASNLSIDSNVLTLVNTISADLELQHGAVLDTGAALLDSLILTFNGDGTIAGGFNGSSLDITAENLIVGTGMYFATDSIAFDVSGSFGTVDAGFVTSQLSLTGGSTTAFDLVTQAHAFVLNGAGSTTIDNSAHDADATLSANGSFGNITLATGGALALNSGVTADSVLLHANALNLNDHALAASGELGLHAASLSNATGLLSAGTLVINAPGTSGATLTTATGNMSIDISGALTIDNTAFTGATQLSLASPDMTSLNVQLGGAGAFISNITADSFTLDGTSADFSGQSVDITNELVFHLDGDLKLTNTQLSAGTIAMVVGGDINSGGASNMTANGIAITAAGDVNLANTVMTVGSGNAAGAISDTGLLQALGLEGLAPASTTPNLFIDANAVTLGELIFNGSYLRLNADSVTFAGSVITSQANTLVQLAPRTSTASISVVETGTGAGAVSYSNTNHLALFQGHTLAIGHSDHTGNITLSENTPSIDVGASNLFVLTRGTVDGLDKVLSSGIVKDLLAVAVVDSSPLPTPQTEEIDVEQDIVKTLANEYSLESSGNKDEEEEGDEEGEDTNSESGIEEEEDSLIRQETADEEMMCR